MAKRMAWKGATIGAILLGLISFFGLPVCQATNFMGFPLPSDYNMTLWEALHPQIYAVSLTSGFIFLFVAIAIGGMLGWAAEIGVRRLL